MLKTNLHEITTKVIGISNIRTFRNLSQCFHFYCILCRLYNLSHGKRQKLIGTSIVAGCQKRESFEGS
ncbi:hypothetical protein L3Y34_012942 [Caenorhabditis briggsae]|uniref:Uncharacterized protein n=1 Tax=Caenorhabditis briggsae TaxID=6238 RepID=A0AAE8ZX47_CAEBR|nr:hypothetical protein L3Y34_012942 [Caenorhabditis briggsae]